jgi:hypothetical protein
MQDLSLCLYIAISTEQNLRNRSMRSNVFPFFMVVICYCSFFRLFVAHFKFSWIKKDQYLKLGEMLCEINFYSGKF